MIKNIIFASLLFTSCCLSAESGDVKKYNDWRLEHPFMHGLSAVLLLDVNSLLSNDWRVADETDKGSIAIGAIKILEENRGFPFGLGVFLGVSMWVFVISGAILRYKNRHLIRSVNVE